MAYPDAPLLTNYADSTPSPTNHEEAHNLANALLNDIVTELGSNPSGLLADLTARLAAFDASTGSSPVSVLEFGAVGTSDDTTVVQAAIDSGAVVELPPETLLTWDHVKYSHSGGGLIGHSTTVVKQKANASDDLISLASNVITDTITRGFSAIQDPTQSGVRSGLFLNNASGGIGTAAHRFGDLKFGSAVVSGSQVTGGFNGDSYHVGSQTRGTFGWNLRSYFPKGFGLNSQGADSTYMLVESGQSGKASINAAAPNCGFLGGKVWEAANLNGTGTPPSNQAGLLIADSNQAFLGFNIQQNFTDGVLGLQHAGNDLLNIILAACVLDSNNWGGTGAGVGAGAVRLVKTYFSYLEFAVSNSIGGPVHAYAVSGATSDSNEIRFRGPATTTGSNPVAPAAYTVPIAAGGGLGGSTVTSNGVIIAGPDRRVLPIAPKTSGSAAAAVADFIPLDTTGGTFNTPLPTAPKGGSEVVLKWVAGAAAPTFSTGGSDALNLPSGATTGTFVAVNQLLRFKYEASSAIWYVETSFSKGGLDTLYLPINNPVATGVATAPAVAASGLTGAVTPSRYVGATASTAPITGTFAVGDFIVTATGAMWVCITAGTPGTWVQPGVGMFMQLLSGRVEYNPGTAVAKSTTSATLADVDATNLNMSVVVPANGKYIVDVEALIHSGSAATYVNFGLRDGSGNIAGTQRLMGNNTNRMRLRPRWYLTSRTPGATDTIKLAFASTDGANTAIIEAGSGTPFWGPVIMEAYGTA